METEIKILMKLIETKEKMTIRELAISIKADYKIVHTACSRLLKKGIVHIQNVGNYRQLSLTNNFSEEIFEAEFRRRQDILKNKNINLILKEVCKSLSSINFILLLFGSYAKKQENNKSDIDLMFIVPFEAMEKEIEKTLALLPLKIHYLVFTELQFNKMKDSKEINVVKEAIKNNVVLYGIEQYYALLSE